MNSTAYAVITPVRNEGDYISKTIASMVAQTLRPTTWIIVDDGSSDATPAIVESAAERHSWIKVRRRRDRGRRSAGGGVVEAFYDGYSLLADQDWDFLVKMDGDLSFGADYFRLCQAKFSQEPQLGIGGGVVCYDANSGLKVESMGDPPFHVRGATKIYRRACWQDVSPLISAPGWDTIDEVKANMKGWRTRTFDDIPIVQHKPTGAADGAWRNWYKNGKGCYVSGYDPLFMLVKCFRRALGSPPLVPGVALGAGYLWSYVQRLPRPQEADVTRYLRQQQRRRMLLRDSIYRD